MIWLEETVLPASLLLPLILWTELFKWVFTPVPEELIYEFIVFTLKLMQENLFY